MKTPLQMRIFYLVSVLMVSSMLFLSAFLLNTFKNRMSDEFIKRDSLVVREFSQKVSEAVVTEDRIMLDKFAQQLLANKDVLYLQIYSEPVVKLFEKAFVEERLITSEKPPQSIKSLVVKNAFLTKNNRRISILDIYSPVFSENTFVGFVRVGISLEGVDAEVRNRLINASIFVACFVIVGLFASFFFSRSLTKPIIQLTEATHEFSKGNLGFQVKIDSKDEIGELAVAFNNMTQELQRNTTSIANLNREITERKKAEEALREAEEKYRTQFEEAMDAIFVADAETGILIDCNPAAAKLVDREKSELIGQHQRILHPPGEIVGEFTKTFEQHLKEKTGEALETRVITKKGEIKVVAIKANLFEIRDRKVLQGIFRDITERKRYEERLSIVNNCLLNFGADPLKNIQNLTIVCGEILDGVCSLYNRLEGGLLCSRGEWNVPPDYNPIDKPDGHICYDVIKQGSEEPFIVRNLPQTPYAQTDPNVTKYKLQTYIGMVVKSGGKPIGAICVVYQNDFVPSEDDKKFLGIIASAIGVEEGRKSAEEALEHAYEQLKTTQAQLVQSAKMASVGLLAGGVAHEINNPLTGVLNNVQLIRLMAGQRKDFNLDDFKTLLAVIEDSAQRCTKITRSLLDFSRASKGIFQKVSLNDITEKVISLIEHELRLENIIIQKDLAPDITLISGDLQLLQQVVFDIISNAKWAIKKKTEKEGGLITVKSEYNTETKQAFLYISDTGIGIPEENLERIFEPFFTTKSVGEGTGLGLSIVYNIIKQHNGTIEVESEVGKGATFKISLPAST
jgi:PAS domain S-box-containing protein